MLRKAKNSTYMKQVNRQLILNLIRHSPVSRAELARKTGLTRAAITMIADDLIKDRVVVETGISESAYGRKPVMLEINPKRYYTAGLNITRYGYDIGIVDLKGKVAAAKHIDADSFKSVSEAVNVTAGVISDTVDSLNIGNDRILGIGAASPGPLDIHSGVILNTPNFEMWHNVNIVKELEQKIQYKVLLENISNARAVAEKSYGAGKEFDSFMLIVVDEGIGSGIIIKNRLYHGEGGFGSEFGHTSISFDGRPCTCGNRGCVETYASIQSILRETCKKGEKISSWKEVVDLAENGDERCLEVIKKEALYLSQGIINAMNLLELQAVILAGDINYKPDMLLNRIRKRTRASLITRDIHDLMILNSSITENSEILSPAAIMIEDFFSV